MTPRPLTWSGRYIDEMSREELIDVVTEMAKYYEDRLSEMRRQLADHEKFL